ncbi:MAG: vWA domain-containing protein [Thermoanaerobaculia bacterium]
MRRFLIGCLLLGATLPAAAAAARRHVRVVLDLSQSMKQNDPGRLAVLSTILLHDLAAPRSGDTFRVVPFDLDWKWPSASAPPPVSTQPRIDARPGQRDEFVQALRGLPYDARMTYFHPGLAAALGELEQIAAAINDVRVIVLVTDGVPESSTRDAELRRIRDELAPRLERHGIRLYILAFGSEADRNRDFFGEMLRSPTNKSLGEYLVDPQGTQLLSYMVEIFSRSFGYSPDSARQLPVAALDLEYDMKPEAVAVAVFSPKSRPPALQLTAPPNGTVNAPEPVQSAATAGGSYSLRWVLSPDAGSYGFTSDASPGQVAVLRPTRLALEIRPGPPMHQTERALAETPFPLRVLVRPAGGAQGDPGPVDLSFRTLGERVFRDGKPSYERPGPWRAPLTSTGTAGSQGRMYDILAEFEEDGENPNEMYIGYVEVQARRGDAMVGSLTGVRAHRVEVHPRLAITPVPLSAYASKSALERRQRACTTISFIATAGQLPHPDKPAYPIRAFLVASDPAVLDREFHEAAFTLDGQPLDLREKAAAQPAPWSKGKSLAPAELQGPHELCVRIGKPKAGDPTRSVDLNLALTLFEVPYDEFGVVQPFQLKVLLAPPTFLERWRALLIAGMTAFMLIGLLWYSRDRPQLPPDLGYAVGRESTTSNLTSCSLDERSAFARLLGWISESVIIAPGEDRALGRIRPADAELFQLRPARGVQVEPWNREDAIPMQHGLATIEVHRTYRLKSPAGSYLFRMEYR